jgi:hypothetical protein
MAKVNLCQRRLRRRSGSDGSGRIVSEVKATATTEVKTGQLQAAANEMDPIV